MSPLPLLCGSRFGKGVPDEWSDGGRGRCAERGATFFTSGVAAAGAQPPGNHNWITLDGTCAGQPVTLLDPRGGNTGFVVGGSVGVGKTFRFIDTATNTVILEVVTGRGIDPDRLVTCEFPLGNGVLIVVEALITPQGP